MVVNMTEHFDDAPLNPRFTEDTIVELDRSVELARIREENRKALEQRDLAAGRVGRGALFLASPYVAGALN